MSRIDDALRRVSSADGLLAGRQPEAQPAVDAHAFDASMLDKYAVERAAAPPPVNLPRPAPAFAAAPGPAAAPARHIVVAAALENKLVIGRDITPPTIEQYRRLAAVLHDYQVQHGLKTLTVTSTAPQEGKTLTVANVALTLSESYRQRVLVVDADLRRPALHQVFSIPNGAGLSDLITGGTGIVPVQLSPYLSILTAGRRLSSPLALLTSDRIREVVANASTNFDWVFLDTTPVGFMPDAQHVARLSDAVLFVIAAGVTPYTQVQRAIADIGAERLVGTVLNRVDKRMMTVTDSYDGYFGGQLTEVASRR